jgi:hypothetical protein
MAYFEEGSEALLQLEAMVDKVGVRDVLYALAHISHVKSDHIRENWQDATLAFRWEKQGCAINRFVARTPQLRGFGL